MLIKDDSRQQMVYYQTGIGTYTIPQIAMPSYAKLTLIYLDPHPDASCRASVVSLRKQTTS
ncbi:hypothetical protein EDD16DRAFT_1637664 [Pisolithus croceorrhizus]|nr:hypothetical protein EDD16DRAFT_1637664 [Pisolithus croceorrhizus]